MATRKKTSAKVRAVIPNQKIESRIYVIRGHRVMLDSDLTEIYQVETRVLNQAVKRNKERFPEDFMFQFTRKEFKGLRSQFVMSSDGSLTGADLISQSVTSSSRSPGQPWGGTRKLPNVFTEHGALMLASVLKSPVAVEASIQVVRAFARLREVLVAHKELASKLDLL